MIAIEQKVPTYVRTKSLFLVKADEKLIVRSASEANCVKLSIGEEEVMVDACDLHAAIVNALNSNRR